MLIKQDDLSKTAELSGKLLKIKVANVDDSQYKSSLTSSGAFGLGDHHDIHSKNIVHD